MNNKVDRKDLILRAALQHFVEEGYDRATIQNIAKKACVGKGTIYEYFTSKEALFGEVVLTGLTYIFDELMQVVKRPGPIYSKVKRLYEKNAQLFHSESELRAIMLNDFGKIPKQLHLQLQTMQKEMQILVESSLKEAIDNGELRNIHPGIAASVVLNGLKVIYFYQLRETETYEEVIEQQLKITFSGLAVPGTVRGQIS
ncbi:TetR/AcrR family transcriptional regulator [Bacillus sp. FJAT-29790]|uniref:TetR/AcrR family transcriptional regulator n=1 Tax=Bacillus sp. FJAT-29790 TaxID=1895002 RepID=UPI001C2435C4|nr:TetR/AcrR family transcriptional regulator [Bacillus sp. FJAT-29790]MBU8881124.1 TetR/AcrR family transcriptional regulator [Bacillus sp. FJAT-29790]